MTEASPTEPIRASAAGSPPAWERPAWVDVDLGAIRANVVTLKDVVDPASLVAVVKGDAYGHGAIPVSRAVLDAGAVALGVATVSEAVTLRRGGIDAPIMVLSEVGQGALADAARERLELVVCTAGGVQAAATAARAAGAHGLRVHLKIDTGMRRVGCAPAEAVDVARKVLESPELELAGIMTHLAVADDPSDPFTDQQLDRFDRVLAALETAGLRPDVAHAANSAGAIAHPRARYDAVRTGIAIYGISPSPALDGWVDLRPALEVRAHITALRAVEAGEGVSYGLTWRAPRATVVATVPVGYADGIPRRLGDVGGEVLVAGRRCAMAGTITMDQLMIDVGGLHVQPGDEVVLMGSQGSESITAQHWADRLGTIAYEVVTGLGTRLPRYHHG